MNGPVDRVQERTGLEFPASAACGSEVLPKERVVDMSTAVELNRRLERDLLTGRRGIAGELAQGLLSLCTIKHSVIQLEATWDRARTYGVVAIDIGLVMLFVVESHDLLGDVGLERIVRVREFRELYMKKVRGERALRLEQLTETDMMIVQWWSLWQASVSYISLISNCIIDGLLSERKHWVLPRTSEMLYVRSALVQRRGHVVSHV
jgi:hypothetical protein